MATYKKIDELNSIDTLENSDLFLVKTSTGTKKVTHRDVVKNRADTINYNSDSSKLELKSGDKVLSETTITIPEGFSGNYEDLSNKPTIPTIPTSLPANGGNADTVGGKSVSELQNYNNLTNKPSIPTKTSQLTNDSNFSTSSFSGNYNDLTNKPAIPSKTSQLTNDSGFGTIPAGLKDGYVHTGVTTDSAPRQCCVVGSNNYTRWDGSIIGGTDNTDLMSNTGRGNLLVGWGNSIQGCGCISCGVWSEHERNNDWLGSFILGHGRWNSSTDITRGNRFRIGWNDNNVYSAGSYLTSGADYAEFIKEWHDGNPDNEDRVGYFVTIKDGKLYKANDGDYIVGITSGNPGVIGNGDETYFWKFERDKFNRFIWEDVPCVQIKRDESGAPILDANGEYINELSDMTEKHMKLREDYDPSLQSTYIERKDRPEWDYVGMLGVLPVRDDGTCIAGSFCKCGENGIATSSTGDSKFDYYVIERIDESIVSVILK